MTPDLLRGIIGELVDQLPAIKHNTAFDEIKGIITLVDGSLLPALPKIATDILDVPAEVIALIYKHRWAIEIFFRFFKHVLGRRHLISHRENGIEIQTYLAIIACPLIALWTGQKPTLRTYEMISFHFTGLAGEKELLEHIEKLKNQS